MQFNDFLNIIRYALKTPRIPFFSNSPPYTRRDNSHMFLTFAFTPAASQLLKASDTLLGMIQEIPLRFKKILHSCWVYLQCRNRWFTVSNASPQRKQLEHKVIPHFLKLS